MHKVLLVINTIFLAVPLSQPSVTLALSLCTVRLRGIPVLCALNIYLDMILCELSDKYNLPNENPYWFE